MNKRTICLDVETTGVDTKKDEILQLSIIDKYYNTLLNRYYKPVRHMCWPKAQSLHGISPSDVNGNPSIVEDLDQIQSIIDSADIIVTYNGEFDFGFLENIGIHIDRKKHYDVMKKFAPIFGVWSEERNDYKWQTLSTCAEYFGYVFKPHDSLSDVKATLFSYYCIQKENGLKPENKNYRSVKYE